MNMSANNGFEGGAFGIHNPGTSGGGFGGGGGGNVASFGGGGGGGGAFGGGMDMSAAKPKKSKPTGPKTDYKGDLKKSEQKLLICDRDMRRWQRRALRSEARFEALRAHQIHLLMNQVGKEEHSAATTAWLVQLLNNHGHAFHDGMGGEITARRGQVKTRAELESQLQARPEAVGANKDAMQASINNAMKEQNKLLEQSWFHDMKPVLKSFQDADRLLESEQTLLCAWNADLAAARQLVPTLTQPEEREQVSGIIQMCEALIIMLEAKVSFLEKQNHH